MYELHKVGERTYYISSPTNIGIYNTKDNEVYIIDSGYDRDVAKKVIKITEENGWVIKGIINTHSNADHVGGNAYLQETFNCEIISSKKENVFIKNQEIAPVSLYGGFPLRDLRNKFIMADSSNPTHNIEDYLPEGLSYMRLPGHCFDMVGIKTSDDVWFLGDCIFDQANIEKHHILFMHDVKGFLNTLSMLRTLEGKLFIPSHTVAINDLSELIVINEKNIYDIIDNILKICVEAITFDELLKKVFDIYNLKMNINQYVIVGSTIRSFLSYLYNEDKLIVECVDNRLLWKIKK